jgi:hypothetical protein
VGQVGNLVWDWRGMQGQGRNRRLSRSDELQSPRAGCLAGQVGKPVPRRRRGTSLKTCPGRDTGRQVRPNPDEVRIPAPLQSPKAGCLPGQVGKPVPRWGRGTSLKTCPGRDTGRQVRLNPEEVPIPTPLQSPTVGFLPGQVGKPVPRWSLSDFATGVLPHCPPPRGCFAGPGMWKLFFLWFWEGDRRAGKGRVS